MVKHKKVKFVTAAGTAKYPKLHEAYSWSKSQNRSIPDPVNGHYEMTVAFTPEDAKPLQEAVKEAIELSGFNPANLPFKRNEESGLIEFRFKAYGTLRDGSPNRVAMLDSATNHLPTDFRLTGGSVVKVTGWINVAQLGVRLNMSGVQILKYIPWEERSGTFEPQEDGFVLPPGETTDVSTDDVATAPTGVEEKGTDVETLDF
jgi:hypothetical protein